MDEVTAVPEALKEDTESEELHNADLHGPEVGYTLVQICRMSGGLREVLQLVSFAIETFDRLNALYCVCDVLQGLLELTSLFVCSIR